MISLNAANHEGRELDFPSFSSFAYVPRRVFGELAVFDGTASFAAIGLGSKPALLGSDLRPLAPPWASSLKKPGENHQRRGKKWRKVALFQGQKRHFAVL
jgi:hypothetical protein